jgi:hypothetical protein
MEEQVDKVAWGWDKTRLEVEFADLEPESASFG